MKNNHTAQNSTGPRKMLVTKHFSIMLQKNSEFERVFKNGRAFHGPYFTLKVLLAKKPGPSRFGIVISTKTAPLAVDRNRTKRRLKEIIRLRKKDIHSGFWVVLILKPEGVLADYQELEKEFVFLAKKAGIIKSNE